MYDLHLEAGSLPAGAAMLWLGTWAWLAAPAVSPITHVLFPNGRLLSPRWSWVIWLALASMALLMGSIAVAAWPLRGPALLAGPSWGPEVYPPPPLAKAAFGLFGVSELGSLVAMVARLRRATGNERQQLKGFIFASLVIVAAIGVEIAFGIPVQAASLVGGFLVPIIVAVLILRYRLYDIDRIISRTLAYGLLTVLLAGGYAGIVLALGQLLGRSSSLAVAAATLAVAAAFQPARRRIQQAVDQRFNRRRYDAAQTIAAFSTRLRQQIDLDTLSAELLGVVEQTMQPASASLWLRPSASASPEQPSTDTPRAASQRTGAFPSLRTGL
jgi:hypothetical protein